VSSRLVTAVEDRGHALANISDIGRSSPEVFVVDPRQGVCLASRRASYGLTCAQAVVGNGVESGPDQRGILGEQRLCFEDRGYLGAGSPLGLVGKPGQLLGSAFQSRTEAVLLVLA
jgi:hypothetical protein